MDVKTTQLSTAQSHRILLKKLEVLQTAYGKPKETIQEALLTATKLQHRLLRDLRACPPTNAQAAHELQFIYIQSMEVTLTLLKHLDSFGTAMVGQGEFVSHLKSSHIDKWIQERFRVPPPENIGLGSPKSLMFPNLLQHQMNYIHAHHILVRIEQIPSMKASTIKLVQYLMRMVDFNAFHPKLGSKMVTALLTKCYLCFGSEEAVCERCAQQIWAKKRLILCKKIGNSLMEPLLKSKSTKVAQLSSGPAPPLSSQTTAGSELPSSSHHTRRSSSPLLPLSSIASTAPTTLDSATMERRRRSAMMDNMKSQLEAIRRANQEKQRQIENMRSHLIRLERENVTFAPILEKTNTELARTQELTETKRQHLAECTKQLQAVKRMLLLRMNLLHNISLRDIDSQHLVPGYPQVRFEPRKPLPTAPPTAKHKPAPTWHFLHHLFFTHGNLLTSMPNPTSTLVPFVAMMARLALWLNCSLPYEVAPLPSPRIYAPFLATSSTYSPVILPPGWHAIPIVSGDRASEHDHKVHQLLTENGRALIRSIRTFPEEAIDLTDEHWLNTLLFSLEGEHVHTFYGVQPKPASRSSSSFTSSVAPQTPISTGMSDSIAASPLEQSASSSVSPNPPTSSQSAPNSSPTQSIPEQSTKNTTSEDKSETTAPQHEATPVPPATHSGWFSFLR